ncbi:MAG: hypothetical protein NTX82_06890 [Candidatus Parcubacteria bacterium]|nr:hypothetical protein [Candidatus Parcubacteria bacterium]
MKSYFAKASFLILLVFYLTLFYPRLASAEGSVQLSSYKISTNAVPININITAGVFNLIEEISGTDSDKIILTFVDFSADQKNQFNVGAVGTADVTITCDDDANVMDDETVVVTDGEGIDADIITITLGDSTDTDICAAGSYMNIVIANNKIRTPYTVGDYEIQMDVTDSFGKGIDTSTITAGIISPAPINLSDVNFYDWNTVSEECTNETNFDSTPVCKAEIRFTPTHFVGMDDGCYQNGVKIYFGPNFNLSAIDISDVTIYKEAVPWGHPPAPFLVDDAVNGCEDAICFGFSFFPWSEWVIPGGDEVVIGIENLIYPDTNLSLPLSSGVYPITIQTYNFYCEGYDGAFTRLDSIIDEGSKDVVIYPKPLDDDVNITAAVDPTISFALSSNTCDLGTIDPGVLNTCGYYATVSTNALNGYVQYIGQDHKFQIPGGHEMTDYVGSEPYTPGTETYGLLDLDDSYDIDECATYDGTTTPDRYGIPFENTPILWGNNWEPVAEELIVFCHMATISYDTPPGLYSHTVTLTVIANF